MASNVNHTPLRWAEKELYMRNVTKFNKKVEDFHPQKDLAIAISLLALSILLLSAGLFLLFTGSQPIGFCLVELAMIPGAVISAKILDSYFKKRRELKKIINMLPPGSKFICQSPYLFEPNKAIETTFLRRGGEISYWKVTKIEVTEESSQEVSIQVPKR